MESQSLTLLLSVLYLLQYFVFSASAFAELFSLVVNTEPIPCPDGSEIVCGKCSLLCLHETVSLYVVFIFCICQHFPIVDLLHAFPLLPFPVCGSLCILYTYNYTLFGWHW